MKTTRKKRVHFVVCKDNVKSAQLSRKEARGDICHYGARVIACVSCFLVLGLVAIVFFLSQSDLTVTGTSWLWGKKGRECKRDKDCVLRLRKDYDTLSWGQCLLPPNGTSLCVDNVCVDPPPLPVSEALDCDDKKWCTVNDKCVPGLGECAGVTRGCHDVDFCTLEICSEHLQSCVSMDAEEGSVCENGCVSDENCRSEYYCANGRCANFKALNESLFFSAYEILPCEDEPHAYRMLQHYIVYEEAYTVDLHDKHQNNAVRYRALKSEDDVHFPAPNPEDSTSLPLVAVSGVQTRVIPKTATTPAYSEITLSTKTSCQSLPDASTCLTKWMKRRYDFELDLHDCTIHEDDPLGTDQGTMLGECLPVKIRRAYSMNLDLVDCPFFAKKALIPPLSRMRLLNPDNNEDVNIVLGGDFVRAVVEMDAEQQATLPIMAKQSPFLTTVTVCTVDTTHRLAGCATGEQTRNCPVRGCVGWSGIMNDNSPITYLREYMKDAERLSAAIQDGVEFCRGVGYRETGCVPGVCDWGTNAYQPPFGSADGILFRAIGLAGQTVVVDAEFRMQYCGEAANQTLTEDSNGAGRRLSSFNFRSSVAFKLRERTEVSDMEP